MYDRQTGEKWVTVKIQDKIQNEEVGTRKPRHTLRGTCLNLVANHVAVVDTGGDTDTYLIRYVVLWIASYQAPGSSLCLGGSGIASRAPICALSQEIRDLGSELMDRGCPEWVDAGRTILVGGSRYKIRPYGT